MPSSTLGNTSVGSNYDNAGANYAFAENTLFTVSSPIIVSSISVYVAASSGSINFKACIWDKVSDPYPLKGVSPVGIATTTAGWKTLYFNQPVLLPISNYACGIVSQSASTRFYYSTGSGNLRADLENSYTTPLNLGNSGGFNYKLCVYLTYRPASQYFLMSYNV